MSDEDPRAELRELSRSLLEQLRWLGETGAAGVPADPSGGPSRSTSQSASPSTPTSTSSTSAGSGELFGGTKKVALPLAERVALLSALAADAAACRKCRLHEGRTRSVFARGSPAARLAFVGEGPGRDEDLQGAPFVGKAGQLLDKMIAAMGLATDQIYICNVVKCRPPNNRTPLPDEAATCEPFLTRQLEVVVPEVVVALGKTAASFLLATDRPMNQLRGRWHVHRGIPVMPTFHPAFLLRAPEHKREVWEDLQLVMTKMGLKKGP